ncbi:Macrophage mannose receptor 1 [Liparis tanakae]|uniref:Macrophage mannose receptor 1 n=1 Tax=Liparis tanakae TaxID=230148 RepID=A0A4Z2FII4_9TELE|nr:Macrophage mannose receptor 1 [Liparis tanakae]
MTMTEAQSHCRENYKDLATIRDQNDLKNLNTLKTTIQSPAWIGLFYLVDNWKWSLSNASFYEPGEKDFRRWNDGEPNHHLSLENCINMLSDGKWNDMFCTRYYKSVCFDVRGPNTFVFIDTLMTWIEAQSYCREHHTDLASVRNMEENQMVQNLIPFEGEVWIGLYLDNWQWSDGSGSIFAEWNPLVPRPPDASSDACVAADFSADGKWETLDCNIKSAFICNIDVDAVPKQVVKVRLEKRSSSLDPNDPVVMEDLLKKLKQRLKDQGLDDDIQLSWRKQSDGKVFHKEEKTIEKKYIDEL